MPYPASSYPEGVDLTIIAGNQLHQVINGEANEVVSTTSGDIPSVRKALADSMMFKVPVDWVQGEVTTDPLETRLYNGQPYWAPEATLANPITLGSSPVATTDWLLAPQGYRNEYNLGKYQAGILISDSQEYVVYNGKSYFATNPPYITTSTTPDNDANMFEGGYTTVQSANIIAITHSLNVEESQVIYSTDTTTVLDDVLYIYDESAQTTWSKSSDVGSGETIVSVVGDVLTTSGGSYELISVDILTNNNLAEYTDIVYKSSGGNSAVENMIAGIPIESTPGNLSATAGYKIDGDGGEAKYVIKTASQASLDEDVIDGFINHALDNGNVAILMMGERLNAKQCGMVADAYNTSSLPSQNGDWNLNEEAILSPTYTDNSDALQAAIDYILRVPMRSPELYVPAGAYAVTRPALIHHADGLLINGAGKMSTMFVPVGDMTPILNTYFTEEQARLDAEFTDPTDPGIKYNQEKAVFMISQGRRSGANYAGRWQKQTGNANWSLSFTNIGCSGGETSTGLSTSFIFAPEFAQSLISNVYVEKVHTLLRTNDCYRMKLMQIEISNSFIPVDHFSTISEANAQAANPEATSNATGTSISLDACGAHNLANGWKFVHIPYSSFNAVAVDNWSEKTTSTTEITSYAYDLERCAGLVLNGCGAEDFSDDKPSGLFKITGGDEGTTIINGGVYLHPGNPSGTTGEVFLLDGLSLELNSCTISGNVGIAIQRGEVFIQGTSGVSLDSFRNKTAYTQIYDGMPITNSRFIPTINGVGKQKFSLFRVVQATQTVTPDLTNGYKVILDTNDSVRGFITQEYGAMMPSKDTIRIPYKGVFSVNISISHNALITNEINLIKESPEGVKTKMIKYVTDSASRGIGDKSFSITAPFGQYDLVYLEVPQIANPGTIYTVTTSVHQI